MNYAFWMSSEERHSRSTETLCKETKEQYFSAALMLLSGSGKI
jgi:hypothetical protein